MFWKFADLLTWIRIRIDQILWIRIQIESIRIHITDYYQGYCAIVWRNCCLLFTVLQDFSKIEDVATDEELDMLDLAFGLTDTSRLGCQVDY